MFNIFEGTFLEWFFPSYLFGLGFGGSKKGGGGGTVSPQPQIPSWQSAVGSDLSEWTRKYLKNYVPGERYSGTLSVTEPSIFEQFGLGELADTLTKPALGELYSSAKGNIVDTLSGKFADPASSPFIQAATRLSSQNLQDAINTSRGQRGARGTFFTRAALKEEADLTGRTQNNLNAIIGEYINQERGRQLQAAPIAQSLEQYGIDAPLKRVAATQTLGALPRILEQADLERVYQDYLRQRNELAGIPNVGQSVLNKQVPYGYSGMTAPTQSGASQIAPWLLLASSLFKFK